MAAIQKFSELEENDKEQIVFLALAGTTVSTISSHLKIAEAVIHEVLASHVMEPEVDETEKNYRLDLERLGRLSNQLWAKATQGDSGAAYAAMGLMDRRASLIKDHEKETADMAPAASLNSSMKRLMSGVEIPDDPEEDPPGYEGSDSVQYELEEAKHEEERYRHAAAQNAEGVEAAKGDSDQEES